MTDMVVIEGALTLGRDGLLVRFDDGNEDYLHLLLADQWRAARNEHGGVERTSVGRVRITVELSELQAAAA